MNGWNIKHMRPMRYNALYLLALVLLVQPILTVVPAVAGQNQETGEHTMNTTQSGGRSASDGVDKRQAVLIAKQHLKEIGAAKNCLLIFPRVRSSPDSQEYWDVIFWPSPQVMFRLPFTFSVEVNKKTGQVKSAGWNK